MRRRDEIMEQLPKDFAQHQIETVLDSETSRGRIRVYRCAAPDTWIMGFYVVFSPGAISLYGDIGDAIFTRERDMFAWLQGSSVDYMLSKCQTSRSHDVFRIEDAESFLASMAESDDEDEARQAVAIGKAWDGETADSFANAWYEITSDCEYPSSPWDYSDSAIASAAALRWFATAVAIAEAK